MQMVLVLVHSHIFLGNYVFRAFLASCATPFDHALAKFEFGFGFKMKASTTMPSETTLEVRGHRETRLIYIHAVRRTLAYISGTFHVHFMAKPCRIKVAWLFQLL